MASDTTPWRTRIAPRRCAAGWLACSASARSRSPWARAPLASSSCPMSIAAILTQKKGGSRSSRLVQPNPFERISGCSGVFCWLAVRTFVALRGRGLEEVAVGRVVLIVLHADRRGRRRDAQAGVATHVGRAVSSGWRPWRQRSAPCRCAVGRVVAHFTRRERTRLAVRRRLPRRARRLRPACRSASSAWIIGDDGLLLVGVDHAHHAVPAARRPWRRAECSCERRPSRRWRPGCRWSPGHTGLAASCEAAALRQRAAGHRELAGRDDLAVRQRRSTGRSAARDRLRPTPRVVRSAVGQRSPWPTCHRAAMVPCAGQSVRVRAAGWWSRTAVGRRSGSCR